MIELAGKKVYISGGSSGIGLAVGKLAAAAGADVLIIARDEKKLAEAKQAIADCGPVSVDAISLDAADNRAVEKVLPEVINKFGAPDILINSIGIGCADYFENIDEARFDHTLKINLYAPWNLIRAALPFMKKSGGHIVNVSSVAGFLGVFGFTSYSAAKFGLIGLSQALRAELKPDGILVSVYCPPDVDTPMMDYTKKTKPAETKLISSTGGLMSPEQAAAELFAGLARNKLMIVPGFGTRMIYLTNRLLPAVREAFVDFQVKRARKKLKPGPGAPV